MVIPLLANQDSTPMLILFLHIVAVQFHEKLIEIFGD